MGLLEDALRETFAARVAAPPAVDDAAGRAIRDAHRVRRRRTVLGGAATALCVALVGLGTSVLRPGHDGATVPQHMATSTAEPLPLDLLVGQQINRIGGGVITLPIPTTRRAWHTASGWLVLTEQGGRSALYLVAFPDPAGRGPGAPVRLAEGAGIAVSADGLQVAWGGQGSVVVAARTGARLVNLRETSGTGALQPIAFAGGGVLLAAAGQYDMWFPDKGPYRPGPKSAAKILVPSADGSRLYGLAGASYPCLAQIDPNGLKVEHLACDIQTTNVYEAYPSPDGRWLALTYVDRVELYDLNTMWTIQEPTEIWWISPEGVAWLDGSSFVVGDVDRVVTFAVDRPGRVGEMHVARPPSPSGPVAIRPIPLLD